MSSKAETITPETKAKRPQVSTTVSEATLTALQELRWTQRHNKLTDTVRAAVEEYVATHAKVGGAAT